jgi:hypothetical protein
MALLLPRHVESTQPGRGAADDSLDPKKEIEMENKIGSFVGAAAGQVTELFQDLGAAAAGARAGAARAADGVDHAVDDDGAAALATSGGAPSTGDRMLDDHLLMARTSEGASAAGPFIRQKIEGAEAKLRAARPTMTVESQYDAAVGQAYVVKFNRPVSRDEAAHVLFRDGAVPKQNMGTGESTIPDDDKRMMLWPVGGKDGKAQEWVLRAPNSEKWTRDRLAPGVEDALLDAPATRIPEWVPAGTLGVLSTGEAPQPGDPRFASVKNGFPPPNEQVTAWRDGNALFRYDRKTGRLEGIPDAKGAEMGGFNRSMDIYVLGQGRSISDARKQTQADFGQYFADGVLLLAMGSVI